eukprot:3984191-Lingulodinium_polyedra.AAC.1
MVSDVGDLSGRFCRGEAPLQSQRSAICQAIPAGASEFCGLGVEWLSPLRVWGVGKRKFWLLPERDMLAVGVTKWYVDFRVAAGQPFA